MKVFSGTDRRNATAAIQGNATAVLGAPIRVPTSSGGAIVVVYTDAPAVAGSVEFSHKVIGSNYKWFEFVGTPIWVYYLFLVVCALALCLFINSPCLIPIVIVLLVVLLAFAAIMTLGTTGVGLIALIVAVLAVGCCSIFCCAICCYRRFRRSGNTKRKPRKLRSRKTAVTRATVKKQGRVAAIEKQKMAYEPS